MLSLRERILCGLREKDRLSNTCIPPLLYNYFWSMKKRKILLTAFLPFAFVAMAFSQEKWDLRRCVDYALANNLTVKQTDIQAQLASVDLEQNKWAQYPTADFGTGLGLQWGRSIDPTTNQFTSNQLLYQNFNLQAGIAVFNWHRIRNAIIASRHASNAAGMDVEKIKNDIALNVATYYLQVLLARQQVDIAKVQLAQTSSQIEMARKKVDAGAIPELDALTLEGQYATDSSNYISAQATADQNLLELKQVLNIDAGAPFDIDTPPVDQIPVESLLELQPETVYQIGVQNQPAQKANELRIRSQEATVKSSKGNFYPTISIGGGLSSTFSSLDKAVTGFTVTGTQLTGDFVKIGTNTYPTETLSGVAITEKVSFADRWDGWGRQMNDNFRQNLGVNISVPILSGGNAKFNYQRSKINLKNAEITKDLANQTLKNDIYKAYYSASAAMQKFNATKTSVALTQKTYDFAVKRFDLGLLNTFDLITSQNNLTRARLDQAAAQFDYVFKMKVLEFYKGQGLKL